MEAHVLRSANLSVGAQIVAARDFGPILAGQLGMITGKAAKRHFFPWRMRYLCTFLGDMKAVASQKDIANLDHGCSPETLEDPLWFIHGLDAAGSYDHLHAWDILRRAYAGVPTRPRLPRPSLQDANGDSRVRASPELSDGR